MAWRGNHPPLTQALHTIIHVVPRGQEQHGNLIARSPGRAQDAAAIEIREQDMESDQVVAVRHGQVMALEPRASQVDDKPRFDEALPNVVRGLVLVFDNEQSHGSFLTKRSIWARPPRPDTEGQLIRAGTLYGWACQDDDPSLTTA